MALRLCRTLEPLPTILVDDGEPHATLAGDLPHVRHIVTEWDIGLSAGRNLGVREADTKYVCIFDDDFTLPPNQSLDVAINYMESHPELDILTFWLLNDAGERLHYASDLRVTPCGKHLKRINATRKHVDQHLPIDMGFNCFIAKRESLLQCPWDDDLKLGEHWDFFLRAKRQGLKVALHDDVTLRHGRAHKNARYRTLRNRVPKFKRIALRKHGFLSYSN